MAQRQKSCRFAQLRGHWAHLEKERAKQAQTVAENAALSVRIEERDGQIKELKATLKEAGNDNKKLQAELVDIAKKSASQ